jgi:hypothetical protein
VGTSFTPFSPPDPAQSSRVPSTIEEHDRHLAGF